MTTAGTKQASPFASDGDSGVWRSRLYLPHFELPGAVQMITFRLADSLPNGRLLELRGDPDLKTNAQKRQRLEEYLDNGYGVCHLCNPAVADLVEANLLHFDGERYYLHAWVVMPYHVYVLIETMPEFPLSTVARTWKSFTSKAANKLLGQKGSFWQPEYFDCVIRNEQDWLSAVEYIHNHPVKAGLVARAEDWQFSSARRWLDPKAPPTGTLRAGEAACAPGD